MCNVVYVEECGFWIVVLSQFLFSFVCTNRSLLPLILYMFNHNSLNALLPIHGCANHPCIYCV